MSKRAVYKYLVIAFMVVLSVLSGISIFQRAGEEFWHDSAMNTVRLEYAAFNILISALCIIGAAGIYTDKKWGVGIVLGICTGMVGLVVIVPLLVSTYLGVRINEAISLESVLVAVSSLIFGFIALKLSKTNENNI